uniref:Variant surface glycoprotein 1125.4681 n=1 Tax=Trypanosoma brucei TaxID=5691 RepID=A0A1J0RAT1_9TRYP|nr:variant surface glycoprotein 1125.4681 [Trypanosoma brucei]
MLRVQTSSLVALIIVGRTAIPAANDNAHAFGVLCTALNVALADPDIEEIDYKANIEAELGELLRINMSLAEDSFYNQDFKTPDTTRDAKEPWKTNKEKWQQAKQLVQDGKHKILDIEVKRPQDSHERNAAAAAVNTSLRAVESLLTLIKTEVTKQAVIDELRTAAYGQPKGVDESGTATFSEAPATGCGDNNQANSKAGKSIANDMVCLCSKTLGSSDSCTGTAIGTSLKYTNRADAVAAFNALKPKCHKTAALKATEATIAAAVTQFVATLRAGQKAEHTNKNILGSKSAAQCNAGVNDGCVLYKDTPETGILPVDWLIHLETAAAKLSRLSSQQQANEQLLEQAKAHTQTAVQAYINARNPRPETLAQAQPESKEQDCKKHQSKIDCKEPCKLDENATDPNKKFSLDPVKAAEQQATQTAGTGEGAGGTTADKCKGKEQKDCKSPYCNWDGKECKDSSILAIKQLTIIVSAFVA